MSNPRVHQIASDVNTRPDILARFLRMEGERVKSSSATVAPPAARHVRETWSRIGERFVQEQNAQSPATLGLSSLSWTPRDIPKNLRQVAAIYDAIYPDSRMASMLGAGAQAERLLHLREDAVLDIEPHPDALPLPMSGAAFLGTTRRLLIWLDRSFATIDCASLSTSNPSMELSRYDPAREVPDILQRLATLLSPDLGIVRARTLVPTRGVKSAAPHTVVLSYRTVGDRDHKSPDSRRSPDHRWTVRAHSRRQWYPRAQEHRLVWIDSHSAGPRDAPLIEVERVEVY